jgi:hypothetical protein
MRHSFWKSFLVGFPCLALVVLPPAVGHAEDDDRIWEVVLQISQLYEKFEYEQAFATIQGARRLPRSVEGEVTLSLYEGILLCEMSLLAPSRAAFREALLMRPGADLPENVAPKVEQLFEAIRQEVTREKTVTLAPSEPALEQEPSAEEDEDEDEDEDEEEDGQADTEAQGSLMQVYPEQQAAPVPADASERGIVQAMPEMQAPSTGEPAEPPAASP